MKREKQFPQSLSFPNSFMAERVDAACDDSEDSEIQSVRHIDGGELRLGRDKLCGRDSRRTTEDNMMQQGLNLKYQNLLLDKKTLQCILFADSMEVTGADNGFKDAGKLP